MEMEVLIREFSETLISELALRDELEYEKELKNTFISLLLAVQNRRRQYHVEKKKGKAGGKASANIQNSSGMLCGNRGSRKAFLTRSFRSNSLQAWTPSISLQSFPIS